jgi:hypothetical protein
MMAARSVPERPDASEATSRISGTPNMYHRPIEYANCTGNRQVSAEGKDE